MVLCWVASLAPSLSCTKDSLRGGRSASTELLQGSSSTPRICAWWGWCVRDSPGTGVWHWWEMAIAGQPLAVQGSPAALPASSAPFQPGRWEMGEDEDGQSRQPDLRQLISGGLVSPYGGGQASPERARTSLPLEVVPNPEPKWDVC